MAATGNHHAALTRNLSLGPLNDAYHSTRHDPMRLPDAHLQQANATAGAVRQERERFIRSRNNDDVFSEWNERSRTERVPRNDHVDMSRPGPPLNSTKSAPTQIPLPREPSPYVRPVTDPYRADSMYKPKEEFRLARMRRAETMAPRYTARARRERESTRKPQKFSGLRRTENLDSLPTPSTTPEPPIPQKYGRPYADDHEVATPDGYRTKVHEPVAAAGSRKVTRSPSPIKAERVKEDRGPGSSPKQPSRTYVYGAQGLQDVSASRPTLERNTAPKQLYGEVPTSSRSSPRQTRTNYPILEEDSRYARFMSDDRPRSGYNISRRNSEAVRPTYARNPSHTSQAAAEEIDNVPERRAVPSTTLSHQLRLELVCQTVSRDDTSSEDAKITSFVKMAMEPHIRKVQMSKVPGSDKLSLLPSRKMPRAQENAIRNARPTIWRRPSYTSQDGYY